ncbi:hypothetical protein BDV18DRAFT_150399 [Aspergillus unguis]
MLAPNEELSFFSDAVLQDHLGLLGAKPSQDKTDDVSHAPIVASSVLRRLEDRSTGTDNDGPASTLQYGLLAGSRQKIHSLKSQTETETETEPQEDEHLYPVEKEDDDKGKEDDPRLLFNVTAPSSTFICGSQGSGKSHTLSCMLEACLIPSKLGRLAKPLTGVVFHYDTFISDTGGSPCEAAYLASSNKVDVRVLCAPTNVATIKRTYQRLGITVEPLQIDQSHLNTKRMMDLMAVSQGDVPLYMESIKRILREMRIVQQQVGGGFDYKEFKRRVDECDFTPGQLAPLTQRLDALESFMPSSQTQTPNTWSKKKKPAVGSGGTDWTPVPGRLTIVDLSCPCVSPETACALFNICLGIFLQEENENIGRVFALDEAHKYMTTSPEAAIFTETILSAVRLQRHLGVRVIVSTQEPTISTALLNLCSVTIVHRFTSPEWLKVLRSHLAAASKDVTVGGRTLCGSEDEESKEITLFERIIKLGVGEALLFAPSAIVGVRDEGYGCGDEPVLERLGGNNLAITVRGRLTQDGGRSVLSV